MKTRVRYTGPGGSAVSWFEGSVRRKIDAIQEAVEEASESGKNISRHHIETRGTAKSGKRGRIETRQMLNAVDNDTPVRTNKSITSRFGWIKEFEDYFGYQERGFNHVNGQSVEGMYAITDAGEEVSQDLFEEIEKIIYGR